MNLCVNISKRNFKKKTTSKIKDMKRFILLFIVTLCSVFAWGQSSVVQMGEAVIRCNDFSRAKTMLLNEGLYVVKSSTENSANTLVFSNRSNDTYRVLNVILTKMPKSKKIQDVVFRFHPNGRYYASLSRGINRLGYSYCHDNDGLSFKDIYHNGNHYMGVDIDEHNWMVVTFYRAD